MKKYYNELYELLKAIKMKKITRDKLNDYLLSSIDCEYIYEIEDTLLSDIYFTLKHYALHEEDITKKEVDYFLECLEGKRVHSFDDKLSILKNNL